MAVQHKLPAGMIILILIVTAGGILYNATKSRGKRTAFQEVKMSQLVETDKSRFAAVSPDGRYVAYTVADGNKQSLVLRLTATNINTVLVPATEAWFNGVTFSPDGNLVYFLMSGESDPTYSLYRVYASGGESQKALTNVASPITFSPDGRRFAFVRNLSKEETGLFIANADGSEERLLGKRRSPNSFSAAGASWSPDGRLIACPILDERPNGLMSVVGVSPDDGSEKILTNEKWSKVLQVAWLSDNSGFIMAATQKGAGALLWHVSYPEGNSRRLTNDPSNYPSNYDSLSLTADSRMLVASRFELRTNLWTAPSGEPGQIKQITFGGNHRYKRLAWTPDSKIVFPSDASGDREIWIMEEDGSGQKQLTADGRFNQLPAVSSNGRHIVFVSGRAGNPNIWRMNIDGSNPIQLTHGETDFGPECSPDGQWVFYTSVASEKSTIWRVSIDGGEAVQLTKEPSTWPVVSPDGRWIACWWWSSPESPAKVRLIPLAGEEPVKSIDSATGSALVSPDHFIQRIVRVKFIDAVPGATSSLLPMRWTSDSRALIYCVTRNNISNFWSQPIDGGAPRQLTDFKSETVQGFDWSKDDRLLVSRGFISREIVLVEDVTH
jgi:Tol biopolymer transport system component